MHLLILLKHCVDHTCRFPLTARAETVSVFTFRKQNAFSGNDCFFFLNQLMYFEKFFTVLKNRLFTTLSDICVLCG